MERRKHILQKNFPHVGMRIIKTGLSVFICLLINYFFSPNVALASAGATCVTMQATLADTKNQAFSQIAGTLIGGGMGCALLPVALRTEIDWLYVLIMPLGCALGIYLCVALGLKQCASICAFVYVIVLITPYNGTATDPYFFALSYIADTLVGVIVALLVNRFVRPPKPKPVVHVETNTYADLLRYIENRITGTEQLILLNSDMVRARPIYNPSMRWRHRYAYPVSSASIAVPQEYSNFNYISCVYVTWGYKIIPLFLRQKDGYVSLPPDLYPVTVIWPAMESDSYDIKGKIRQTAVKGATSLPEAVHPEVLMHDPTPDTPAAKRRIASTKRRPG